MYNMFQYFSKVKIIEIPTHNNISTVATEDQWITLEVTRDYFR